jgi:predicted N-acyltransferase
MGAENEVNRYRLKWVRSISEIDRQAWNAMAAPLDTPLLEWEWLYLMEASESISPRYGWLPHHLTVWSGARLVGAAPLYVKSHSAGEFVFDYAWADLADRLGITYYPKMVGMSPVTPLVGYRFLTADDVAAEKINTLMVAAVDALCRELGLSGVSFLFVHPNWRPVIEALGFVGWKHQSYVWQNPGFSSFDDYLAVFNANQRRNIRRERRRIRDMGISITMLAGDAIPENYPKTMYRFYKQTNDRYGPWGCKFLTEAFFSQLMALYRHRLVFAAAVDDRDGQHPLAMAMLLKKGDRLYGRYWGSRKAIKDLHFNVCYYQPIEYAIANDLRWFDPGAGSPHKVRRGFSAVSNYSMHRFFDPRLQHVLRTHIDRINRLEQREIDELNSQRPLSQKSS